MLPHYCEEVIVLLTNLTSLALFIFLIDYDTQTLCNDNLVYTIIRGNQGSCMVQPTEHTIRMPPCIDNINTHPGITIMIITYANAPALVCWCCSPPPPTTGPSHQHVSVARLSVTVGRMLLRLKPKKAVPELARGHLTS